ncbi:MAG: hypothetical protein QME62_06185 [Armatimonadota bacterium]|nr:hypothetical protein [Armatimonadota bacterium]
MTWLIVFVGIIALCNLLLLSTVVYLAFMVRKLIVKSAQPAMAEVTSTIKSVNCFVEKVENRVEHMMEIGESTAKKVSDKVIATADIIKHSISSPLISILSIITGVSRAISELKRTSEQK